MKRAQTSWREFPGVDSAVSGQQVVYRRLADTYRPRHDQFSNYTITIGRDSNMTVTFLVPRPRAEAVIYAVHTCLRRKCSWFLASQTAVLLPGRAEQHM